MDLPLITLAREAELDKSQIRQTIAIAIWTVSKIQGV